MVPTPPQIYQDQRVLQQLANSVRQHLPQLTSTHSPPNTHRIQFMNHILPLLTLLSAVTAVTAVNTKVLTWKHSTPHRKDCYTQGLSFINATHVLQSCGLYELSFFHILKYSSPKFELVETYISPIPYDAASFLEGSLYYPPNGLIYILTWREHTVFRIELGTMALHDTLYWAKEGWGLTHNQTHLMISDGSSNLYICDEGLNVKQTIRVTMEGREVVNLNELEWVKEGIDQFVYANVYTTSMIVKISLGTGEVASRLEGRNLLRNEQGVQAGEVLNGMAAVPLAEPTSFVLTGKHWSQYYLVEM